MLIAKNKVISTLFLLFTGLYLAQTIFVKPPQSTLDKYHITAAKLAVISLTIAIPYIIIWMVALVGYIRLHAYTELIKKSRDGEAFRIISFGILWLSLWLPISTITGNLASHEYSLHPSTTANLVRLVNYSNIIILFPAFIAVYIGSKKLLRLLKVKQLTAAPPQIVTMLFIGFSALYVLLTLHDSVRQVPKGSIAAATYYEPDWLLVITIIIPRLIMWFLGIQAAVNIYTYSRKVNGLLYRQALKNLARGIAGVVIATIVLRCVQSLSTTLNDLSLALLLGIVYVLLIIISIGYILIEKGARNLTKLEEI